MDRPSAGPADDVGICPACRARNPSAAKFCMECGARMSIDEGERRTVSVLFADLSGFTSYSETVDPEAVRAVAETAAQRLGAIAIQHGGTIDKIIGDCVMAVWGAPVAHEDDAERAVRAAIAMNECVREYSEEFAGLQLSTGVHTGEAIYAPVGPHGEFTVLGDTVNTAARLQSAAQRGQIFIGTETARAIAHVVELEELDPIVMKGKQDPVPAWRASGIKGHQHKAAATSPFVGRRTELDRFSSVWERTTTQRAPHLIAVLGPAGIGKSRLIEVFIARTAEKARVLRGSCLAYGEGITYWPVVEMIKGVAQIKHDDPQDVSSRKLGALLESLGIDDLDQLRTIAISVAHLVGAPVTPRGTYRAEEISRSELHWGIRRLLELMAAQTPLVCVIEDIHNAQPTLVELIEFILAGQSEAPILIVASARPEFKDAAPPLLDPKMNRRLIDLEPLDEQECMQMLERLTGDIADNGFAILRAAEGNPLFLEEIVRMVPGATGIPSSLQGVIDARIDRLADEERRLAGRAAVIGNVFWSGALRDLDESVEDPSATLNALIEREIIVRHETSSVEGEDEFAFKHGMFREVAYARIPKATRAALHERSAHWIGGLQDGDEFVEISAHHLALACVLAREVGNVADAPVLGAVEALKRAADKAERRQGIREADRSFARALELLANDLPEVALELHLQRARTATILGDLPTALATLDDVANGASRFNRWDLRCNALIGLAELALATGKAQEATGYLAAADPLVSDLDDPRLAVKAAFTRAELHARRGASDEAMMELRTAIRAARDADDLKLEQSGTMRLATVLFNSGEMTQAEEAFERAASLAQRMGALMPQAMATTFLGYLKSYGGPRDEAARLCEQAVVWFERTPHGQSHIQALTTLARLSLRVGDAPKAERRLREALLLARKGGGSLLVDIDVLLVMAHLAQGQVDDARDAAREARANAHADDAFADAQASIAEGLVAAAEGRNDFVRDRFDGAIASLSPLDVPIDLAEARLHYARVLARMGDLRGAGAQLEQAGAELMGNGAHALAADIEAERAALDATAAQA